MSSETKYEYDWESNYDKDIMLDFNHFLKKINTRACIQNGFIDEDYDPVNRHGKIDHGLGYDVEYFHPTITLDDRMRYIGTEIAAADMSKFNILGNTLISHFYGARGVHQAITQKAGEFVDFDRIADGDADYRDHLYANADNAKKNGLPIWGTTELHTSIQTGSRNYCRKLFNDPDRKFKTGDVLTWVASFRDNGVFEALDKSEHIEDTFKALTKLPGIGEYYGFHGAASTSVLPFLGYNHDQRFVAPGPGAVYLINHMWPNAPKKLYPEAIYFLREQCDRIGLTDEVDFHPDAHNIELPSGKKLFTFEQDSLKYYGTEVLSCQFGIYLQIREDKKACERRKVSRSADFGGTNNSLEAFM